MTPRPELDAVPDPPLYWMHEISGVLARTVMQFMQTPAAMTTDDIAIMRAYLVQWIHSGAWELNPAQTPDGRAELGFLRSQAHAITTVQDIRKWIRAATAAGMDPL